MPCRKIFEDEECLYFESDHICYDEHGDACSFSNFLDKEWLSSSGNSCEDLCDRQFLCFLLSASAEEPKAILTDCFNGCRSIAGLSSENLANDLKIETRTSATESGSSLKVSMFYFSCSVTSCMMPLWRPFQGVVWSLDQCWLSRTEIGLHPQFGYSLYGRLCCNFLVYDIQQQSCYLSELNSIAVM